MHLEGETLQKYRREISTLYEKYLHESPTSGLIYFGSVSEEQVLKAVGGVRCYMGSWYLRGCVVKPEFRGMGLQQELIYERLAYLSQRTDTARVSVFPENKYSRRNIEATGFRFERKKKFPHGREVLVYKIDLKSS